MKKVIRLDEPTHPKPIELTHTMTTDGWVEHQGLGGNEEKVVYLGNCKFDGDMFVIYSGKTIDIHKGHLNDGVY